MAHPQTHVWRCLLAAGGYTFNFIPWSVLLSSGNATPGPVFQIRSAKGCCFLA